MYAYNGIYMTEGIIKVISEYGFEETLSNVMESIKEHGITIFSVINHKKNAEEVGLSMANATLLIFGNAQAGTKLMQDKMSIAIDLPLRLLISEEDEKVVLRYYNPLYLAKMHQLDKDLDVINKVSGLLNSIVMQASGKTEETMSKE